VDVLLSFAAALVSLRLAGSLFRGGRPAWGGALLAYAAATAATAWGSAHGWDSRSFRVYYLAGGLLTAPLLGVGSLLFARRKWAAPLGFTWVGLSAGLVLAMPVHGVFSTKTPAAQDHLDWLPRMFAIAGNSLGTVAVIVVALSTFRGRPVGNAFILAGVAVAAAGSTISGLGVAGASGFALLAVILLYLGVVEPTLAPIMRRASRAAAR
jgi:hypothetical protein